MSVTSESPPQNESGVHSNADYGENNSHLAKKSPSLRVPGGDISPPLVPSTSRYLPVVLGGSHWRAEGSFENIVIMGDSYSMTGSETWAIYLERHLRKQNNETKIYNFAFPGATAEDDLSTQRSQFFSIFPKKHSSCETPALDPDRTTYFIFLGINDCMNMESDELESVVETILDAAHDLYVKAGARNFIFVNIPPIHRSPQGVDSGLSDQIEERVKTWNVLLEAQTTAFGSSSTQATVLLFSSHEVLTDVLDDPSEFDFDEDDPVSEGGGIWDDDLHLTTDIHHILARQLHTSLLIQNPEPRGKS